MPCLFRSSCQDPCSEAVRHQDNVQVLSGKLGRQRGQAGDFAVCVARFVGNVPALEVAQSPHRLNEDRNEGATRLKRIRRKDSHAIKLLLLSKGGDGYRDPAEAQAADNENLPAPINLNAPSGKSASDRVTDVLAVHGE